MRRILAYLAVFGFTSIFVSPAVADPQSDMREFQKYFEKIFPGVKFDRYGDGLYALPQFTEYRSMWELYNDFPPYELGLTRGKQRWSTPFANGGSFRKCVKDNVIRPANVYPRWDKVRKEVRTAEMDINECLRLNGETEFTDLDKNEKQRVALAELTAAFYSIYRGQRVKPDLDFNDPDALAAYERGKKFYWSRRGQLNFSCASCHVELAGKNYYGNQPLSAGLGHPVAWPAQRLEWGRIETIGWRYATCNIQARAKPFKHDSDEYRTLQLYETYMSSGMPLAAPSMRN